MAWVAALVKLFSALAQWWQERQLIKSGADAAKGQIAQDAIVEVQKAQVIEQAVTEQQRVAPDKLRDDPNGFWRD